MDAFQNRNLASLAHSSKPDLSFSIERILGKKNEGSAFPGYLESGAPHSSMASGDEASCQVDRLDLSTVASELPWLSYTRYSPPKIPRIRRTIKRKTSGNPRVPFSTSQLMTLERKYTEARYLSGAEVSGLSSSLNLSEHRVKIWFQNRRAREKKAHHKKSPAAKKMENLNATEQTCETQSQGTYFIGKDLNNQAFFAFGFSKYKFPFSEFLNHM